MNNSEEIQSQDPILSFLEAQKAALRADFRIKKDKLTVLQERMKAELAFYSKELNDIKDRLTHIDKMESERLRDLRPNVGNSPSLPMLGKFKGVPPQSAIIKLFQSEPHARLSAAEILDRLVSEGFEANSENPVPLIFTTCKRLKSKGFLREELVSGNRREFFTAKY